MDLKNLEPMLLLPEVPDLDQPDCSCSEIRGLGAGDCKCGGDAGGGS